MEKYAVPEDLVERLMRDSGISRQEALEKVASGAADADDPARKQNSPQDAKGEEGNGPQEGTAP